MILVAEGPSAAGKSRWAAQWPARLVVPEMGRVQPPGGADRDEVARFFVELNTGRWSRAIATERAEGIAICDTDPLKLHYDYCLARVGEGSWEQFQAAVEACRSAIERERLGIADVVVCDVPGDTTLDRRRRSDAARTRRNFAVHRMLGPALADWYRTLEQLEPGRVAWGFPAELPRCDTRQRFDLPLFDEWMQALPHH
jgi:hypothetical protein